MNEFIVTFGYGQPLAGCFTRIEAANAHEARGLIFKEYGNKWAFMYNSEEEAGVKQWGLKEVKFGTPN